MGTLFCTCHSITYVYVLHCLLSICYQLGEADRSNAAVTSVNRASEK